jgi:hypothetical protein
MRAVLEMTGSPEARQGLGHFDPEVVALAGALADAGEHRHAAVLLGDVVDELLDEHGLAHAGAAEEADLAALLVGREQVDHLDARGEISSLGFCSVNFGGSRWIGRNFFAPTGPASSTGSPTTLRMRPRVSGPTGIMMGLGVASTSWPRTEAVGGVHGDGAHGVLPEVLGHLEHKIPPRVAEGPRVAALLPLQPHD